MVARLDRNNFSAVGVQRELGADIRAAADDVDVAYSVDRGNEIVYAHSSYFIESQNYFTELTVISTVSNV